MADCLTENGRAWSQAWCDSCRAVRTFALEYLPASDQQPHDGLDVVCTACYSVIATLHDSRAALTIPE